MDKKRWLFATKVQDKAGTLTAVSSVFSNRGISVRMNVLLRAIRRLPTVISAECYPYDSPKLRAVAFARVNPRLVPEGDGLPAVASEEAVTFAPIVCNDESETWILMAPPRQVTHCLERLQEFGALLDVSVTIIPVE